MQAADKERDEAMLTRSRPLLGPSRWIDVAVKTGGPRHFISEQGRIVRDLVAGFLDRGLVDADCMPLLFVISPFRSVADEIRKLLCQDFAARGLGERAPAWCRASVGTVAPSRARNRRR